MCVSVITEENSNQNIYSQHFNKGKQKGENCAQCRKYSSLKDRESKRWVGKLRLLYLTNANKTGFILEDKEENKLYEIILPSGASANLCFKIAGFNHVRFFKSSVAKTISCHIYRLLIYLTEEPSTINYIPVSFSKLVMERYYGFSTTFNTVPRASSGVIIWRIRASLACCLVMNKGFRCPNSLSNCPSVTTNRATQSSITMKTAFDFIIPDVLAK